MMILPVDEYKLEFLRQTFRGLSREAALSPRQRKLVRAAAVADLFDNGYGPVIRRYYAYTGDLRHFWFTQDALTLISDDDVRDRGSIQAAKEIVRLVLSEIP